MDASVEQSIVNLLGMANTTPALRAALLEVLAGMPDAMVELDATDPAGRPSYRITVTTFGGPTVHELYVDPATHELLAHVQTTGDGALWGEEVLLASGLADSTGAAPATSVVPAPVRLPEVTDGRARATGRAEPDGLADSAGVAGAFELGRDLAEHAVHEPPGVLGRELLRGADGLVDRGAGRDVAGEDQLEGGDPQDRPVDRGHPVDPPSLRDRADGAVDLLEVLGRPLDELAGVGRDLAAGRLPRGEHGGAVGVGHVRLVQDVEGEAPGLAPRRLAAHFTRSMYAPERVSTLTRSPSSTNSGTCAT